MAVRGTIFELTLPSWFFSFLDLTPPPPPAEQQKGGYERAAPKPPADALRLFPFASFFATKALEAPEPSIDEKIKHLYQGSLKSPFNLCRHAVLKMISQYLRSELKISRRDVREIVPSDIFNGDAEALASDWQRKDFKGPVRNPPKTALEKVKTTIAAYLAVGLPAPVYVSHTHGKHLVLVTKQDTTKDGRVVAYHFIDSGTRFAEKSRGTLFLTKEGSGENFVKPGNTNKKVAGTTNQRYDLLAVNPIILENYKKMFSSGIEIAKAN